MDRPRHSGTTARFVRKRRDDDSSFIDRFCRGILRFVRHAVYQNGIDISAHQPTINWTNVKNAGIKFSYTKATEGVDFVDTTFASHMTGDRIVGVLTGPYHYARPDSFNTNTQDAANEANDFVDAISPYYQGTNLTLRPVLDLEELAGVADEKTFLSNWVNNFQAVVHNRLGFYADHLCEHQFCDQLPEFDGKPIRSLAGKLDK